MFARSVCPPKTHELLDLRRVEPLNGGGAANFGSGAANLFLGPLQNLAAPPFLPFSCGFPQKFSGSALVARIRGSACAERQNLVVPHQWLHISGSALVAPH